MLEELVLKMDYCAVIVTDKTFNLFILDTWNSSSCLEFYLLLTIAQDILLLIYQFSKCLKQQIVLG